MNTMASLEKLRHELPNGKLCTDSFKKNLVPEIVKILTKNGAARAGVFGSYARGEETEGSDIDILVEFKERKNLFDLVGLEQDMKKKLGSKVDLVTYKSLSPYMRDDILRQEVPIL
jgi:uncharacterized protein